MAPAPDRDTVKVQLATTRATLRKAGIPYAWLDAEILVAHVLDVSRERLHSHPEQRLTEPQQRRLRRLACKRPRPACGRSKYRATPTAPSHHDRQGGPAAWRRAGRPDPGKPSVHLRGAATGAAEGTRVRAGARARWRRGWAGVDPDGIVASARRGEAGRRPVLRVRPGADASHR